MLPKPRLGAFVTGTDTGIGKTVVAACLAARWDAEYWKPVQTGLGEEAGDSDTVARLAQLPPGRVHPPRHAFAAPLSPEAAAALEGCRIALDDFTLPHGHAPIVVEGAGGVLVPLAPGCLMTDLMQRLGLPAILVARGTLGTINHTLLSLEALRSRGIPVLGVVMVGGEAVAADANRGAIERHSGGVRVLAMLPVLQPLSPQTVAAACRRLPLLPARKDLAA